MDENIWNLTPQNPGFNIAKKRDYNYNLTPIKFQPSPDKKNKNSILLLFNNQNDDIVSNKDEETKKCALSFSKFLFWYWT